MGDVGCGLILNDQNKRAVLRNKDLENGQKPRENNSFRLTQWPYADQDRLFSKSKREGLESSLIFPSSRIHCQGGISLDPENALVTTD